MSKVVIAYGFFLELFRTGREMGSDWILLMNIHTARKQENGLYRRQPEAIKQL